MSWQIYKFDNLNFHVQIKPSYFGLDNKCLAIDFEVYDLYGFSLVEGQDLYYSKNNKELYTEDIRSGDSLITGQIKWDGCSHINFGENGYIHGCSPFDMIRFGDLFRELWKIARIIMPGNEEFLLE